MPFLNRVKQFSSRNRQLTILFFSTLFVIFIFADVVFKGASFSMMDHQNFAGEERRTKTLFKEPKKRFPYMGLYDAGGAAFQSEPAYLFMKHVLRHGESPYWDPYTSAGGFGPELLVDLKFSPVTVLVAALGGSQVAFNIVVLTLYILALFFLFKILNELLGLSTSSAIAGCVVALLSGYFMANLNSNTTQIFLYVPMTLFFLFSFNLRPTYPNYLFACLSVATIYLVTFVPTTVLATTCIFFLAMAHAFSLPGSRKDGVRRAVVVTTPFGLAFLLVAFLYLPIVEVLRYSASLEAYGKRTFYPANGRAILTLFSPKNFGESYNAASPAFYQFQRNIIFHWGILAGYLMAQGFSLVRNYRNPVFVALTGLLFIALGRNFNGPVVTPIVEHLPFFGNVACQYWWMVCGITIPFLVSYGFDTIQKNKPKILPILIFGGILIASGTHMASLGFPGHPHYLSHERSEGYVRFACFLILFASICLLLLRRLKKRYAQILLSIFLGMMVLEFMSYMNHARYLRRDIGSHPPDYVEFIKKNLGDHRIVNYGMLGVPAQLGAAFQIPQLEAYTMNLSADYVKLCNRAITNEPLAMGTIAFCVTRGDDHGVNVVPQILDLLSVKFIIVSKYMNKYLKYFEQKKYQTVFDTPAIRIFENPSPLPRVFAVSTLVRAEDTPEVHGLDARQAAVSMDPKLLALSKNLQIPDQIASNTPSMEVGTLESYRHAYVRAQINMRHAGVVVLMDTWHPNWSARVDGQEAYLGKVNQNFRGLALPAGTHTIEMSYRPATLTYGLAISLITFFIMLSIGLGQWIMASRK